MGKKTKGKKTDKVAYSKYFNSYIRCVSYKDSTNWTFVLCDADGRQKPNTFVMKAQSYYTMFDWKEV